MQTKIEQVILEFENRVWKYLSSNEFKKEFNDMFEYFIKNSLKEAYEMNKLRLKISLENLENTAVGELEEKMYNYEKREYEEGKMTMDDHRKRKIEEEKNFIIKSFNKFKSDLENAKTYLDEVYEFSILQDKERKRYFFGEIIRLIQRCSYYKQDSIIPILDILDQGDKFSMIRIFFNEREMSFVSLRIEVLNNILSYFMEFLSSNFSLVYHENIHSIQVKNEIAKFIQSLEIAFDHPKSKKL